MDENDLAGSVKVLALLRPSPERIQSLDLIPQLGQPFQFLLLLPAKAMHWVDLITVSPLNAGVVFSPPLRI